MSRKLYMAGAGALLSVGLALGAHPAPAAKTKSCTRDGAKVVAAADNLRVVKLKSKLLGCSTATGTRFTVGQDIGTNEFQFEFLQGSYIGVREYETGEVGVASEGRVYHVKSRKLRSSTAECDKFSIGDDIGPDAFVFLRDGGMAMTCDKLVLIRKGGAQPETLEPQGTKVSRLAVSANPQLALQTLYWIVTKDGQESTKSLTL